MRVVAGTARGIRLQALPGVDVTRPTLDAVKEAMFSPLQFVLPGARVLDLFGGSGQLGIEALSRGADHADIIDRDSGAIRVIKANCAAAGVSGRAQIRQCDSIAFLAQSPCIYDIILLDPPFRCGTVPAVLPMAAAATKPGGTVVAETEVGAELPQEVGGLVLTKQHKYGKVMLSRYTKQPV